MNICRNGSNRQARVLSAFLKRHNRKRRLPWDSIKTDEKSPTALSDNQFTTISLANMCAVLEEEADLLPPFARLQNPMTACICMCVIVMW